MKTRTILLIIASIALVFACRYAGKVEFTDEVISSMSDSAYSAVVKDLGGSATQSEIAAYYIENQEKYSSIK